MVLALVISVFILIVFLASLVNGRELLMLYLLYVVDLACSLVALFL
jgi:hypothetical protein